MHVTAKTKINSVIASLFLVGMAICVFFGVRHVYGLGAELVAQAELVANNAERQRQVEDLSRLISSTQDDRTGLSSYILSKEDTITFLTIGEQLATQRGVLYVTESLREVESAGGFDQLVVAFTMEGPNDDVQYLLRTLEALPYHGELTRLQFDKKSLSGEGEVRARVELTVTLKDV